MSRSYFQTVTLHHFVKFRWWANGRSLAGGVRGNLGSPLAKLGTSLLMLASVDGCAKLPEGCLLGLDLAQQFGWVEGAVQLTQALFGLLGDLGCIQDSLVGASWLGRNAS